MKSIRFGGEKIYPSKIVCIGRNYVDHIKELGNEVPAEPVIFLKPNSAISAEVRANDESEIHFEGEISFLVVAGELVGVGFGLDLTKRDIQFKLKEKGLPWERSKAFDGSAIFSEFVTLDGEMAELRLELYINDGLAQEGGYGLMMNKPEEILTEVKSFLSFEDGDLIMTGTPKGVGPINTGDLVNGKIFAAENLLVEGTWLVK
jgi:2-keto-4-pentenoate hydratase/2-oxohepta-3-ene-1,7-dioic acid hydratase in catechol pathway